MAQLGLEANYTAPGDFVGAKVYLQEGGDFRPDIVKSGTVRLRNARGTVLQSADLDYRYGNAEGFFRVIFMHPIQIVGLSVMATVERIDTGEVLAMEIDVTRDPLETSDFALAEQRLEQEDERLYPFEPGMESEDLL